MKIELELNNRILIKDNNEKVNINDGQIIQYTGIYYKPINDIVDIIEIETTFIGVIICEKYRFESGIIGIYLEPLYIWDKLNSEWNKIINYENYPKHKYSLYPHLLILSKYFYHFHPLYFLHTCENKTLNEFNNINKTFTLL